MDNLYSDHYCIAIPVNRLPVRLEEMRTWLNDNIGTFNVDWTWRRALWHESVSDEIFVSFPKMESATLFALKFA